MSGILFGDTMVPSIGEDYILLFGYSIIYKEYNLTRFNHQKTLLVWGFRFWMLSSDREARAEGFKLQLQQHYGLLPGFSSRAL